MIDPATIAALVVVGGSVVAISARNGHVVAVAVLAALAAAPFVASPQPDSTAAAARVLGAVLAAYLLWFVARVGPVNSAGSGIGIVAELAAAAAAFAIGLRISVVDPLMGPRVAQAAGLALLVLAVAPLAGQDVFRLGLGAILLTLGSALLLMAWIGPVPPLAELALTGLLVGLAGATSVLMGPPRALATAEESGEADEPGGPDGAPGAG
jgi:hypothetical protein